MMNIRKTLKKYHFNEEVIQAMTQGSITTFYPPQSDAINANIIDGKNLLLAVPTAAGKTFMAEICMIRSIMQTQGRCLYIAPLKALASEKFNEFKKKYNPLGIKVGIAIGDLDSPSKNLNRYQILIATAEKVDSLLRFRAKWLINGLSVVVLDEIHFINDGSRGPTLEVLTARIKQLNPNIQILALSATVQNAQEIASWLNACCITSSWRPVPLKEGVYFNETITFGDNTKRLVCEEPPDDLSKICLDTLRGKGQILVFVNSRRSAQAASLVLSKSVGALLNPEERASLKKLSKEVLGSSLESTKICKKLSNVLQNGVAFHHAGLRPHQRLLIEQSFKNHLIKIICSTPTLAAGVNLPARRTILRDSKRYESGLGAAYIPASEYKQCAGRAGRPGYDQFGEAVIIAKTLSESRLLFDKYIHADPEPVISKLSNESALRIHILSSIAAGHVHNINEMFSFISHTFLYHQKRTSNLIELISRIFTFLEKEKLIEKNGFRYFATSFGQCVSRLYIDPITGIILRNGLEKIEKNFAGSSASGLLHLICCTPDMDKLKSLSQKDYDELEYFSSSIRDEIIMTPKDLPELEDFFFHLSILKTTWLLLSWTNEEKEESLCDRFNIGPGDIHRYVESARWILHATSVLAELFRLRRLTFIVEDLYAQVRYGVKSELLDLVTLKGIGRIRARSLFEKGFKNFKDLRLASVDKIASVNKIGNALAKDISSQVKKHMSS